MPRPRPLVAALAVSIALASACSSDAGGAAASTTLRIGLSAESGALDPHAFTGNFLLLDAIYEPLVGYGADGRLEPGLAESWTVAEDGRRVTFDLRDGVRFTDGTPVDAAAVKWNFDRWVDNDRFSFFRASQVISSVEAPDPDTVQLTLSEPYEPLLQEMSIVRPVRLLSPKSAAADGAFQNPVGTGAWKLVSNTATGAVLERNDDYWGTKPRLERIEFKVIPDSQARVDALTNGEIDLIGGAYLAPITPVEARSLSARDDVKLLTGPSDVSILLGFNPDGPAGDKAVREAVVRAIDTASLADADALFLGYAEPARRVFPPDVPNSGTDLPLGFDRAAAGSVLDAAGYARDGDTRVKGGKPLSLRLLIPATPAEGQLDPRTMAAAIAAALAEVGIGVEIAPVDAAAYYDERAEGTYDITFIAELEHRLAMPGVPDEQRNTTRPADPQQPASEPLPADTLALLGALAATNLLYTQQRWLRSTDILAAVADMLGWPENTEGGRRLSAALAPVGVESSRESIEGKKYTVYPVVALREAIKRHHQQ